MIQWLINLFKLKEPKIPGYLGRDLSQHRVHSVKYDDLCK
jgi:hypothetical protein